MWYLSYVWNDARTYLNLLVLITGSSKYQMKLNNEHETSLMLIEIWTCFNDESLCTRVYCVNHASLNAWVLCGAFVYEVFSIWMLTFRRRRRWKKIGTLLSPWKCIAKPCALLILIIYTRARTQDLNKFIEKFEYRTLCINKRCHTLDIETIWHLTHFINENVGTIHHTPHNWLAHCWHAVIEAIIIINKI